MSILADTLAATNAKLQALVGAKPSEEMQLVKAADVFAQIAAELAQGPVSPERSDYLAGVLADLQKNNWEATAFTPIKEVKDPWKQEPKTESAPKLETVDTGKPVSSFASNPGDLSKADKALLIKHLLTHPEAIAKGAYSDKLDELMNMFGITEDDFKDEYDLRWKVGDLMCALQRAARLETLVAKGDVSKSEDKPSQGGTGATWPLDMAAATFDPVKKAYDQQEPTWGFDQKA